MASYDCGVIQISKLLARAWNTITVYAIAR